VTGLGLDANQHRSRPCLVGLHGRGEFEAVSGDDTVVVIGAGPVGAAHAALARLQGAGQVMLCERSANRLDLAEARARTIVSELRDIAHGIFPVVLAEEGLAAALFARIEAGSLLVTVEHVEERRFDADVEMAAYAVLDEALARADAAAAAAGAAPQVRVAVREREGLLEVDVSAEERDCLGTSDDAAFSDVADRVGALGGVVTLADGRDSGVRLRAAIPILR